MNNYDDLLREKENEELFNDSSLEKHWEALEKKMDDTSKQSLPQNKKFYRAVTAAALVTIAVVVIYFIFILPKQQPVNSPINTVAKSAIIPPLPGTNVPYETFSFDAATGDTLFTLNGSIIIFPGHSVLNSKGEVVTGQIEIRTREFNDPFDYSIAGIPMDYDSAGVKYQFISSAMIDITAFQNGEPLQVNPDAKPTLHLVSTNKERKTSLYKLDTVSGKWMNRGIDEVNQLQPSNTNVLPANTNSIIEREQNGSPADFFVSDSLPIPAPPQKASNLNPLIDVTVDPASFRELLVYDGLKFEVTDAKAATVAEDSKTEWDNIELVRGDKPGTYKVIFSAKNKKAVYNVKPVLEGKDFIAAEKLYQEKLKEYSKIQMDRIAREDEEKKSAAKQIADEKRVAKELEEDNKRITELNKLVDIRNKFIEAENIRIEAINKENRRHRDSAIKANNELVKKQKKDFEKQMKDFQEQQAVWEQNNRTAALDQNLIRSFAIDGFGYWNCDQPTMYPTQHYIVGFKTKNNEGFLTYNTLCVAIPGVNRIENYGYTNPIKLIKNGSCFGWIFNAKQFYYFTSTDFENSVRNNNPITITVNLYEGDVKNYEVLKAYIFNVNNSNNISKK